jgi:hypothetical protein
MPRGRAKPLLVLTGDERATLARWARRPTTAQALAQRARTVLRCATHPVPWTLVNARRERCRGIPR